MDPQFTNSSFPTGTAGRVASYLSWGGGGVERLGHELEAFFLGI